MTARRVGSGLALVLLGLAGIPTQGHALAICVDSKALAIQRSECIARGVAVVSKHFAQSKHDAGAVFGFQGKGGAAAILCDRADKGIVFFTVASADESFCRPNIQRLMNEF
jgi:hypothetical protein